MAPSNQTRVPTALQAVFLASNRGYSVAAAPSALRGLFFKPITWLGGGEKKKQLASPSTAVVENKENDKAQEIEANKRSQSSSVKTSASEPHAEVKKPAAPSTMLDLQALLDALLVKRGYSVERFATLQTAYYNKPTPLQIASYDRFLIGLARTKQYEKFQAIMEAGISPNPCNTHGESLVHLVARLGDVELLKILVDTGCSLAVADDYGRTPMHDACWAADPCFELVEMILDADRRLLHMKDAHGALPLSYVHKDNWIRWMQFLDSKKDVYWPFRDVAVAGEESVPLLVRLGCNTRPIRDPTNALTPELAGMVASGRIRPAEAEFLMNDDDDDQTWDETEVEDDESDYESDEDDSDYDSDSSSFDEDEVADILNTIGDRRPIRL